MCERYDLYKRTFLDKLGPCYTLLDILLVPQLRVRHERLVQPRAEVVKAQRVRFAKIQQLC